MLSLTYCFVLVRYLSLVPYVDIYLVSVQTIIYLASLQVICDPSVRVLVGKVLEGRRGNLLLIGFLLGMTERENREKYK
jgi:hypothetical protein